MKASRLLATTGLLLFLLPRQQVRTEEVEQPEASDRCNDNKLVIYRVIFQTFWSRESFPRQYPEWRPPAQWSKVIGFSHDASYHLFRLGKVSSASVKEFAELGKTDWLDREQTSLAAGEDRSRNQHQQSHILDGFHAPPIGQGVGRSQGSFFVDGNHTRVSLMSKMVPSPDWFVGLDSLDLCENGHFIDLVTVEADPLDAGTDNGLAFTSPNWPTLPQGTVFRITNTYPSHPAGSFHYPDKPHLPTIAKFTFIKEREYELSEIFHTNRDADDQGEVLSMSQVNKYSYQVESRKSEGSNDEAIITFVEANEATLRETTNNRSQTDDAPPTHPPGYYASTGPEDFIKKHYDLDSLEIAETKAAVVAGRRLKDDAEQRLDEAVRIDDDSSDDSAELEEVSGGHNDHDKVMAVFNARKKSGLGQALEQSLKESKRQQRRRRKRLRKAGHCRVSAWSDWSPCSKSCGIGESIRTRHVIRHVKIPGKLCPKLSMVKWCGSERNCRQAYFKW